MQQSVDEVLHFDEIMNGLVEQRDFSAMDVEELIERSVVIERRLLGGFQCLVSLCQSKIAFHTHDEVRQFEPHSL
jgi:hypothetical protein